jgi:hypothetical protein
MKKTKTTILGNIKLIPIVRYLIDKGLSDNEIDALSFKELYEMLEEDNQ